MALMLSPTPWQTFFDDEGVIIPGGLLFTYAAGTDTKLDTFTDVDGNVANTNPIVLDAAGRVPSGFFLLPAAYKFVLAPPDDSDPPTDPIRTQDDIIAPAPFSVAVVTDGTAGENIGPNMPVYLSQGDGGRTAGRWYKMDADLNYASSTAVKTGWVVELISTGSIGSIQESGEVPSGTLVVPGTIYYASATAGAITATAPVNQRKVGVANSASTLMIGVEQPWTATAVPVATADFPTGANAGAGAIVQRSNGIRGLWANQASQFVALNGQVANAANFGAIGDDSTDNSAFIQAAIDSLPATGGTVYLPPGIYQCATLLTLAVDHTRIVGDGPAVTTIKGTAASSGAIKITGRFCGLSGLGVLYTGLGSYGVKIDNTPPAPDPIPPSGEGADRAQFYNVKIKGAASTAHGLWLINSIHGTFNDLYLPCGGGAALRLDSSAFNTFKDVQITVNLGEGSPRWDDGVVFQKQTGNTALQADDNTFVNLCVENVTRYGIHFTSILGAGFTPSRNVFLGGTSEGNGFNILIENGSDNRFYGMHCETADTSVITILGEDGNHINKFYGCSGEFDLEDPPSAQGIQGTIISGHSGNVTIVGPNVFGTQIFGLTGTLVDGGTNTLSFQSLLASPGSATTSYRFNAREFSVGPQAPANAVQGSGGVAVTIVALPADSYGTVHVRVRQSGTTNLSYYRVHFVNGTGKDIQVDTPASAGGTTGQVTFSLSGGNLQAIGDNATAPDDVDLTLDYWPIA